MSSQDTYTIRDLADWSGLQDQAGNKVPDVWIAAIKQVFPEAEIRLEAQAAGRAPADLRALIPRTTIVIRVRAAMWEGLQAMMKAYLATKAASVLHVPEAAAQAASAIDSLVRLRKTVDQLRPDEGELCVYTTIVQARRYSQRVSGAGTLATDFTSSHENYGRTCSARTCKFHSGTACAIDSVQRIAVVEGLVDRSIVKRAHTADGETVWPV
jgi:hypothetical protein